jgi:L-iditol 2-dehydrogenase
VLGHEVVAELDDGRRVALVHHVSCGECDRCLAGHESTCKRFAERTIRPGGLGERVRADAWVDLPADWPDWRGTYVEPLACVLRGAARVPRGRVLIVGNGFVGRLFGAVLERRGDDVFAVDADPRRAGRAPDGPVDAAVLCGPGGTETALDALAPGGTLLVFADAGGLPLRDVYRRELTVAGARSAAPHAMREAAALLHDLEVPEPTVLRLERFAEGLELHRRRDATKVVFVP